MSPEIFQNKPYSYKSDVWALGCVLYEMTTLNHAFDAQSLNGLAGKIVKGRYPPISPKYSRNLRDLIATMLLINPQQRPDLDQILRKTFIKKHILNFLTDIAQRPSNSIGEGTMIVRAAAGGMIGSGGGGFSLDSNVISLQKQLKELEMQQLITEALAPPKPLVPTDVEAAKKIAKDQLSALQREEEHKKMVEAALEKLKAEREARKKAVAGNGVRGAVAGGMAANRVPPTGSSSSTNSSGNNSNSNMNREVMKPAALRQPVAGADRGWNARPSNPPASSVQQGGSIADDYDRAGVRRPRAPVIAANPSSVASSNSSGIDNERHNQVVRDKEREREREIDRRRDDVRQEARVREEARLKEESRVKEDQAAKQRMEEFRLLQQQQQQVQASSDNAAKRDLQILKEKQRQREEIEQLKRDKLELDSRLSADNQRVREERRKGVESKASLVAGGGGAPGGGGGGGQAVGVRNSFDSLAYMAEEKVSKYVKPTAAGAGGGGGVGVRANMVPAAAAGNGNNDFYFPSSYNSRDTCDRERERADDKDTASNNYDNLNARDRVLLRKQEKQTREENERIEALKEAARENRRINKIAVEVQKRVIYGDSGQVVPSAASSAAGSGGSGGGLSKLNNGGISSVSIAANTSFQVQEGTEVWHDQSTIATQKRNAAAASASADAKYVESMDPDELQRKLQDATNFMPSRYVDVYICVWVYLV